MGMVEHINTVPISKEDLLLVADDIAEHHDEPEAFEIAMHCIANRYKGEPQKAGAVFMRMSALARYVGAASPKGWTLPKQVDGSIPTKEAVFAAAAIHPLVEVGNELEFDSASFEMCILEQAESEGSA